MTEMANYVYESYMKKVAEMKEQYKEMYQPPPEELQPEVDDSDDDEENPYADDKQPSQMDVDQEPGPSKPALESTPVPKKIILSKQPEKFVPSLIENLIEGVDTAPLENQGKGKGGKKKRGKKNVEEEEDEEMEEQE